VKQVTFGGFLYRYGRPERSAGRPNWYRRDWRQQQARKTVMMAQQARGWRSGDGERRWLSMLIDAMENVSRPEVRAAPCDPRVFSALRVQLAHPASPYPYWYAPRTSRFSLRN
jgi:hypothetical protein